MPKFILALVLLLTATLSRAINVFGTYVSPGQLIMFNAPSVAPPSMSGTGSLESVFNQAAKNWNDLIGDDWSFEIRYGWGTLEAGTLARYSGTYFSSGGRHIAGYIVFNPNHSWFADGTPEDHSEYSTYREFNSTYTGQTINSGRVYSGGNRFDLLTVATHEIGHGLSIGVGGNWNSEIGDGDIDITSPRRYVGMAIPISGQHLPDSQSLMWYGGSQGERRMISDLDLEAAMQLSRFEVYRSAPVPEPTGLLILVAGVLGVVRKFRKGRA